MSYVAGIANKMPGGCAYPLNVEDFWLDNHERHGHQSDMAYGLKTAHIMTHTCVGNSAHLQDLPVYWHHQQIKCVCVIKREGGGERSEP